MVKGLLIHLNFPYATFPSNAKESNLCYFFMEAIERCGLQVNSITLDGNSVNRRFFRLMGCKSDSIGYKTKHPCSIDCHIFFLSDVPHLIKTTRNCFANPKRNLCVSHWVHYVRLLIHLHNTTEKWTTYNVLQFIHDLYLRIKRTVYTA